MTLADIAHRIQRLTPDSPRRWGNMRVEQMLTHCTDQLRIVLGEKPTRLRGTRFSRWFARWIGLHVPLPFPKNLKTIEELDPNQSLMTKPSDFRQDHTTLMETIRRLDNVPDSHRLMHPVFGALTKTEAIKLTCIHLDHHLQQFGA